jgi:hypothetical protein
MVRELKWQPIDFDARELMDYIRSMGAATLNEIKDNFHTDSASTRKAVAFLYYHQKVWLIAQSSALYVTENTHKKGYVNIKGLRKQAGVQPKKRGPKPKGLDPETRERLHREQLEEEEKERQRKIRAFERGEYIERKW